MASPYGLTFTYCSFDFASDNIVSVRKKLHSFCHFNRGKAQIIGGDD